MEPFATGIVPAAYDVLAPDRSEIRVLPGLAKASHAHCTLPPQAVSLAVTHRTVDEIWYCLGGQGQIWRKQGEREETVDVYPGVALTIPLGTHFQFRNTGWEPLCVLLVTMPPWPGEDEAVRVEDHWPLDRG